MVGYIFDYFRATNLFILPEFSYINPIAVYTGIYITTLEKLHWINLIYNQPGVDKKETHMNRSATTSECEAANCFSPAEVQIEVKIGQAGSISLSQEKKNILHF